MKKFFVFSILIVTAALVLNGCKKEFPVDEDGLLITSRTECFITDLDLLGADQQTVRTGPTLVDTSALTINVTVFFGTDLKNIYPVFSLAQDCKLDPKVVKTDFSDLAAPRKYTVISGNRKIKRTYTVYVTVKQ
ncbi:DUF5018 domain-containing protein [Chitinophaga horti]|uniref:DUF5018 domain-containing protein n=1 Tax=Chitinophaga horti TaxID=2920382 RepID=A0ABY6IYN3_9BACT|nr:DUF5018 domain-containing protein [Chitinophaga horti]UYQ91256.1 DUF5018 domain-containing protein [Chitinophaga horti]